MKLTNAENKIKISKAPLQSSIIELVWELVDVL
jgi:hypothetical protein